MRERRFFVPDLHGSQVVEIRGQEAHHLFHVLRLRPGDDIVVFDGQGRHFRATIASAQGDVATAQKLEELPTPESRLDLTLAVAIPKGDKMALIVRMLTEIGIFRVIPLVTERTAITSASAGKDKKERWNRIALEACKQSGRSRIPEIAAPISFPEFWKLDFPDNRILFSPKGSHTLTTPLLSPCVALIGPEGGWSNEEIEWAASNGFRELSLGLRTLRTETAAVTVASILQWEYGDLRSQGKEKGERRME